MENWDTKNGYPAVGTDNLQELLDIAMLKTFTICHNFIQYW